MPSNYKISGELQPWSDPQREHKPQSRGNVALEAVWLLVPSSVSCWLSCPWVRQLLSARAIPKQRGSFVPQPSILTAARGCVCCWVKDIRTGHHSIHYPTGAKEIAVLFGLNQVGPPGVMGGVIPSQATLLRNHGGARMGNGESGW